MQRVDDKVNNTLNNPLDAEIVDTKVGYMFGNINISLSTARIPKTAIRAIQSPNQS
ncbi:hypothetical protein [Lysinibacillus mangiferihumi]|uniref:hypothetical protein n=1 Tax=Lysinibacillus mangiferihumi TaxID=1130819 RepID=UPI00142E0A9B|nr:hypothetical protein [Lysinibacillus mangiferihumi]